MKSCAAQLRPSSTLEVRQCSGVACRQFEDTEYGELIFENIFENLIHHTLCLQIGARGILKLLEF